MEVGEQPKSAKSEKLKTMRIGLCVFLFCALIQNSILYYSIYYMNGSSSATIFTTLRWTSFVLGILSVFLACIVENQSNCFFHPTDILDLWMSIGFLLVLLIPCQRCNVFLYMYVPMYVFLIKGLLQVFLDPQGIMDLSDDNPKDMAIFRTWSGKVYRGRPRFFFLPIVLDLAGIEERVGKNDWRRSNNDDFLQFNIMD